ncbi:MAG TPA: hypothetical protein VJ044_12780, partial [Candidatus Hodarchaeales archaeon]|nr:hypothetical protein [Candidatus Hodarchaeales archaeon]
MFHRSNWHRTARVDFISRLLVPTALVLVTTFSLLTFSIPSIRSTFPEITQTLATLSEKTDNSWWYSAVGGGALSNISMGSKNITVAILDTGIDYR